MESTRQKSKLGTAIYAIVLAVLILITIFPFVYMVLGAFKNNVDIVNPEKVFMFEPTLNNFKTVFETYRFGRPIKNTAIISVCSTVFSLLIGLPASYAIARFKKRLLQAIILGVRIIPIIAFLVPLYLVFAEVGLTGTYTAIILANMIIALPFIVWVMIPYFESIPKELEEAAFIDGVTRFGAFIKIAIPLSVPGIMTVTIMSFITAWNNLLFGMILGSSDTQTLPTAVLNFISYTEINWGGLMAAAIIITVPIIIISIVLQKYVIQGLQAGAVKG